MTTTRMARCQVCGGDGLITLRYGERETYRECLACHGSGRVEVDVPRMNTNQIPPLAENCMRVARKALAYAAAAERDGDHINATTFGLVAVCAVNGAITIDECPI